MHLIQNYLPNKIEKRRKKWFQWMPSEITIVEWEKKPVIECGIDIDLSISFSLPKHKMHLYRILNTIYDLFQVSTAVIELKSKTPGKLTMFE